MGGQHFSLNLTYVVALFLPVSEDGLNHLSTPSGLILAASKLKGDIAKYIGNPILSKNIQFSPKLEYLELSRRLPKLIFFCLFSRFCDFARPF